MATPYTPVQNTATAHRPQSFKDVIGQETPKAALKAIAKAPATSFLSGPYGTGKCVAGDTLVPTTRGVREIQSLFPGIEPGTNPITPPDLKPDTEFTPHPQGGVIIRTILGDSTLKAGYLFYSGIRPSIKVVTKSGRVLTGSATHPVLVMDMNTRKGKVEYVPLFHLREHHSILGVVSDRHLLQFLLDEPKQERVRSMMKDGFIYKELLSLSVIEQVNLIAERLMEKCLPSLAFHAYEKLFLVCESYEMAMAVSTIVGMVGCLSRIEPQGGSDARKSYTVHIAPVSHESSLNQILLYLHIKYLKEHPEGITMWDGKPSPLSVKSFYKRHRAKEYMGELPFCPDLSHEENRRNIISFLCGKVDSGSSLDALTSAFNHDGLSIPFADPVVQVWQMQPRPLYDMNIPKVHAFSANGLIVHNTTLAAN